MQLYTLLLIFIAEKTVTMLCLLEKMFAKIASILLKLKSLQILGLVWLNAVGTTVTSRVPTGDNTHILLRITQPPYTNTG